MTELLDKIRFRGHWRVVIRPTTFDEARISSISSLRPIIEKTSVQLCGWDFPHIDSRTGIEIHENWIEQAFEWQEYLEFWRLYKSGQFVDIFAIPYDWYDQSDHGPEDWQFGSRLLIGDSLYTLTEIFEFASRLALTEAGDDPVHIEFTLDRLAGRELFTGEPRRWALFPGRYKTETKKFSRKLEMSRSELLASARDLAITEAIELFSHFGWDTTRDHLRGWQDQLKM